MTMKAIREAIAFVESEAGRPGTHLSRLAAQAKKEAEAIERAAKSWLAFEARSPKASLPSVDGEVLYRIAKEAE